MSTCLPPPGTGRTSARPFRVEVDGTGDPQRVRDVLAGLESWPAWWPGIAAVRQARTGERDGTGRRAVVTVSTPLGYRRRFAIEFAEVTPPLAARILVSGDRQGVGYWRARDTVTGTRMRIVWRVASPRRLVRALPAGAPAAHRLVMVLGNRGLRRQLAFAGI